MGVDSLGGLKCPHLLQDKFQNGPSKYDLLSIQDLEFKRYVKNPI